MKDFELTYYTRRWKANTTLTVKKTQAGWHISNIAINGDTDTEGAPILEQNLHQDNVRYPHDVGSFLGFIWGELDSAAIDEIRAQQMIDEIGDWITSCETSQPVWRPWNA